MPNPLATARQLWRLNKDGRLSLVGEGEAKPLSTTDADAAIKEGMPAELEEDGGLVEYHGT